MRSGKFGSCSDSFCASVPRRGRQRVRLPAVLGSGEAEVFADKWVSLGSERPRERCGRGWLIGKQIVWLPPLKSTWSVLFLRFVMKDKDLGEREGELQLIH